MEKQKKLEETILEKESALEVSESRLKAERIAREQLEKFQESLANTQVIKGNFSPSLFYSFWS